MCSYNVIMSVMDWRDFCRSSMELGPICKHEKRHMF